MESRRLPGVNKTQRFWKSCLRSIWIAGRRFEYPLTITIITWIELVPLRYRQLVCVENETYYLSGVSIAHAGLYTLAEAMLWRCRFLGTLVPRKSENFRLRVSSQNVARGKQL